MANDFERGNKLAPGTLGASFGTPNLNQALESRLTEEMAIARTRAQKSAEAVGTQFVEGDKKLGFTPTAMRTKKGALFKKEMFQVQEALNTAINDVMNSTQFADKGARARKQIELQERAGEVQRMLVQAGLQADLEIGKASIEQANKESIMNAFAGVASSIGFGIASGRRRGGGGMGGQDSAQAGQMMSGLQSHPVLGQGF